MTGWFELVWLLLLLAAGSWILATVTVPVLAALGFNPSLPPSERARRALLIAGLPLAVPLTLVLSICALAAAKPLGLIADHCIYHGIGHPHLCFVHLPALELPTAHVIAAGLALLGMVLVAVRFLRQEFYTADRLRVLSALAPGQNRLRILQDDQPVAFAGGVRHAAVFVSRGLLRRLTQRERRIVLAHEIAHLRNRDPLRNLLFEVLLLTHLPGSRKKLRSVWRQALEEVADDQVATKFGSEQVAGALIKVLRMGHEYPRGALSATGADPLRRIQRLLATHDVLTAPRRGFEVAYGAGLLALAVAVVIAHHPLETLLGLVLGV